MKFSLESEERPSFLPPCRLAPLQDRKSPSDFAHQLWHKVTVPVPLPPCPQAAVGAGPLHPLLPPQHPQPVLPQSIERPPRLQAPLAEHAEKAQVLTSSPTMTVHKSSSAPLPSIGQYQKFATGLLFPRKDFFLAGFTEQTGTLFCKESVASYIAKVRTVVGCSLFYKTLLLFEVKGFNYKYHTSHRTTYQIYL